METRLNQSAQSSRPEANESNDAVAALKGKLKQREPAKQLNPNATVKIDVQHINFFYGPKQALFDVSIPITTHQTTALIGPSGCGKSTFLRILNRMNDLIPNTRTEGAAMLGE